MKRFLTAYLTILIIGFPIFSNSENLPERVISLSPNITEIIYGIGAWGKLVGVTLYSDFPPEVEKLPKVGGWVNPNLEAIVKLKPDLVLLMADQDDVFGDKIRKVGFKTLSIDSNKSVKDIQDSILQIGKVLGKDEEAKNLSMRIMSGLEEIRSETTNIPTKKVLFIVGRNPGSLDDIYVIGKNNYINELISLAGGENVVESQRLSIKISKEAILSYSPELIIEVNHLKADKRGEIIKIWNGLNEVSAVKNNEVHVVSSNEILRPSQRIVEGARILAHIIHPEVFPHYEQYN